MKYLGYIISMGIFRFIAILPRPVFYLLADFLFLLIYYVVGYRKNVVTKNLTLSFPEFERKKILQIRRKFYRHLGALILENAAMMFYSKKRLQKMFPIKNGEIIDRAYEQGRHVVLITAHYGNWEWSAPLSYTFKHQFLAVYMPMKNRYFENAYRKFRGRFDSITVPTSRIGRAFFEQDAKNVPSLAGMVSDQRPLFDHVQYWTDFLNQKTAVFTGSEKLAKKFNAVVVFLKASMPRRGVYPGEVVLITDDPVHTEQFEITEKQMRILEGMIRKEPYLWLWSHNRWKYSYEEWLEQREGRSHN